MDRYVCIHGHFYQPPRENPWLEAIEVQDSAAPFHDWNERIQAECYAPNGASRIRRDYGGPMIEIVNNYRDISFNFGPTLLSWMERADPEGYTHILDGDRASVEAHRGHGNAMAQAYNHMIMPLASERDRVTQVYWGISDFNHRFARTPEGMWLPETAADRPTLRALAEAGIRFTVLSPYQARRMRRRRSGPGQRRSREASSGPRTTSASASVSVTSTTSTAARRRQAAATRDGWVDVSGGRIDPSRPYWCDLGGGLGIAIFFYDGPISSAIAFEGLLNDGVRLGERVLGALPDRPGLRLAHVATDGESYGHHHRHGDMALAAALQRIQAEPGVALTNYGEFLDLCPPEWEVEIHEPSSWSCAHGVGRWSRDCGCSAGTPGFHHRWRAPLRAALDHLKEGLDETFLREGGRLLREPWRARDAYIWVLLDPSASSRQEFLAEHGAAHLGEEEASAVWSLLEMQRHGMLMYTSCGWFFDELSGIEGVQILRYALRALQLAERHGARLEDDFREKLAEAPSNVPAYAHGGEVLDRAVRPSLVEPERILARHAIATCLDPPEPETRVFCYRIHQADYVREEAGGTSLAVGRVRLDTTTTLERHWASYAVLHFGEHDFSCKVHRFDSDEEYERARDQVLEVFRASSLRDTVLALEGGFPGPNHDVRDLFVEERRKLLRRVLQESLGRLASSYQRIFRDNRQLMEFLAEVEIPVPEEFAIAAEYVLRSEVEQLSGEILADAPDEERVQELLDGIGEALEEAARLRLEVPQAALAEALQLRLERETGRLAQDLDELHRLGVAKSLIRFVRAHRIPTQLWRAENAVFRFLTGPFRRLEDMARFGEPRAAGYLERARELAEQMGFEV